jgi:CheY-like chemotaxis protein
MEGAGTLSLSTRNLVAGPAGSPGGRVELRVGDTGTGMAREVLEKALDPFFTTKPVGKGTGLGLAMVYSTVKAHRGEMELLSEPGRGTQVVLRFPACPRGAGTPDPEATAGSGGTLALEVLLVDDDELIQSSMSVLLEVLGHRVARATSGEETLRLLEGGLEPDVVILDMNMPGLGGAGTLPPLRALRPGVPVLLSTGRVDQVALDLAAAHPRVTLLAKPFSLDELQRHLDAIGRS